MGAVDKLLNFMKLTEDEEYDEYDEYEEEEEEPDTERRSFFRKKDTVREESNVIEPITYTSRKKARQLSSIWKELNSRLPREASTLWAERPMRLTAPFRLFPTIFLLRHRTASRSMEI